MQYSCQQNFTLLSTDGYWNESSNPNPAKQLDGSTTSAMPTAACRVRCYDGTATQNTLADVAAYYYETDLRLTGSGYCTSGTGGDLCQNNVPVGGIDQATHQHMTTFTLGLGVSGYAVRRKLPDRHQWRLLRCSERDAANPRTACARGRPAAPATGRCRQQLTAERRRPGHAAVNGAAPTSPPEIRRRCTPALLVRWRRSTIGVRRGGSGHDQQTRTSRLATITSSSPASSPARTDWSGELNGQKIDTTTGQVLSSATDWSANDQLTVNTNRKILMFDAGPGNR